MYQKTIHGKAIKIDGKSFADTEFIECTFIYSGMKGVSFARCRFVQPRFVFEGPAANTMNLLRALHGGGAGKLVERAITEIQRRPDTRYN
jgi:hypothetical protein